MKKRIISAILTICIIIGICPLRSLAYPGDMWVPDGGQIQKLTSSDGKTLALQNDYIRCSFLGTEYGSYIETVPTAVAGEVGALSQALQVPYCSFAVLQQGVDKYGGAYPVARTAEFTDSTPNGNNAAIKVNYDITIYISGVEGIPSGQTAVIPAKVTVYHELVKLSENVGDADAAWGVLTTVGSVYFNREEFPIMSDFEIKWSYVMYGFTGMGHRENSSSPGGPAIKLRRINVTENGEKSTESSVITSRVDDLPTKHVPKGYTSWGDVDGIYVTEVYTDDYPWANPFMGLSDYYEINAGAHEGETVQPLRHSMPYWVSAYPNDFPNSTWAQSINPLGFKFDASETDTAGDCAHFLWGYRDLVKFDEPLPSEPDKVSATFDAKRLAAFKTDSGVTVEYVSGDAALESLKKKYNAAPVAQISGDCESINGSEFEFTGSSAMLSPSVTATWDKAAGGKFIIHRDGTVEQKGVNLNAPSFKFYKPMQGAEESLKIALTENGFEFEIEPDKNEAIIYVDIPYATAKVEKATADVSGNLVFNGEIGFKTVFDGLEFSMEKLGYGLSEKDLGNGNKTYEFKVNGVKAKGQFNTAKLMSLELAKVKGEVNTFPKEECYAFSLELNAFELFETEATLALERSNKGTLLPDELWFYVKASPGIVLVPPVPIGQLNGGGAGFKDLAATVKGDYFAIPPLKLRGALTGTYLHLIEGTGNIVLGPSEISLKATDVNIVGAGKATQIVESFGYTLKLNGQERKYGGETYKGLYFAGAKEIMLHLPSKQINLIEMDAALELGAFGGANAAKDRVYLAVGANGIVNGTVKIPDGIWLVGGLELGGVNINTVIGGQTTFPIKNTSVSDGMKDAFRNIDIYLGAMAEVRTWIADARAWVIIPKIIETNFRYKQGWGIDVALHNKLPAWDWESKGITPVVQAAPILLSLENGAQTSADITVSASGEDTPYILLSFDNSVTEAEVREALRVTGKEINWVQNNGSIDPSADINAVTGLMKNNIDGLEHRVVVLRLKSGGTYHVESGSLAFEHEEATVSPFEKLNLSFDGRNVTGRIDYPNSTEKYLLRTYFSDAQGGADYLIDEREITDPSNINIDIPASGGIAPTGEYYVTSFLMIEKKADLNDDGKEESAYLAADNTAFSVMVNYTNVNQPAAPANVMLSSTGNEVMRAEWDKTNDADGYAITIYREDNGKWIDTGFGYDLDKDAGSIDMALTVGAKGVNVNAEGTSAEAVSAENLTADNTYMVGVRAYKKDDDIKYYSAQTMSSGVYLPEYTPLNMEIKVNGNLCAADEKGIYNAYIGGTENTLTVSCGDENARFEVVRMDTNNGIEFENGAFKIPQFYGTLMLRIDGISGNDVTSEYMLVSYDSEPPMISLTSDVFYADKVSGEYQINGIADAGSEIKYEENTAVNAGGDGTFAVPGTLEDDEESRIVTLCAIDSVGNSSKPVFALVTRREANSVTVNDSYAEVTGSGEYTEGETVNIDAGTRSGYVFDSWTSSGGVSFADEYSPQTSFTMIGTDVTVTANWRTVSSGRRHRTYYTVSFETGEGSKVSSIRTERNTSIQEPSAPTREGYVFGGWYTDKTLKIKYDFSKNVTKNMTLYAAWTEKSEQPPADDWKNPFTDVKSGDWFYANVQYAVKNGLFSGISDTLFDPKGNLTRAMLVTVLWRAENKPQTDYLMSFDDIARGSYYEEAVRWAASEGIVSGITKTQFNPDGHITREQIAAIIFRYAKYKNTVSEDLEKIQLDYADVAEISDYAKDAVAYCKLKGIMQGRDNNRFAPKETATRAEATAVLQRFLEQDK